MRRARGGGLPSVGAVRRRSLRAEERDLQGRRFEKRLFRKSGNENLRANPASTYATPRHSASTTKAYSVSCPVCSVWSQRSNISSTGQITQVSKASAARTREILNFIISTLADAHLSRGSKKCAESGFFAAKGQFAAGLVEIARVDALAGKAELQNIHLAWPVKDFAGEESFQEHTHNPISDA